MVAPMSAYKLRFHLPGYRDRQDTLARVDIVFTQEAGALYGTRLSGIIVKESAPSRFEPSKPYVYYPSRFTGGRIARPYLEAEPTEQGESTDRLTQTILATFAAWVREQATQTKDSAAAAERV